MYRVDRQKSKPTCSLVDAKERDARARSPGGYLTDVLDEAFEPGVPLVLVVFAVLEDDAEVLGKLLHVLDVVDDPLGGVVVMAEDAADFVGEEAPGAAEAEEDAEEEGYDDVEDDVERGADGRGFGLRCRRGAL